MIDLEKKIKSINVKYTYIMSFALLFLILVLVLDMASGYLATIRLDILYGFATTMGTIGLISIIIAILFFPLRKIGKLYRKQFQMLSTPVYKSIAKMTAMLHPVIALFAFVILFLHGYILLVVISEFYFDTILIAGTAALSTLSILFLTGSLLKKNLSSKKNRMIHFSISLLFIVIVSIHLLSMR